MGKGTLTIYSASAGSGKTYTLTEIYLISLFTSRYNYRKILAVTFTNKATAEMKSRILESLHNLSTGKNGDHLGVLMDRTGKSEEWIRNEAGEILNTILHDYSRFSISTIDSFFQKILRAFVRDVGLQSGFNIELDHSAILASAVDEMLNSAVEGSTLNKWLTRYALNNIEEERSWNLRENIPILAQELFKEKYKILSRDAQTRLEDKDFLLSYIGRLRNLRISFEKELKDAGAKAMELYSRFGLTDDMFYRKSQGVPGFIRLLQSGNTSGPNSYVRELEKSPPRWSTATPSVQVREALDAGLEEVILNVIRYWDDSVKDYLTARVILSNIYSLGIMSDILSKIRAITQDNNSFLLSEAGDVLSQITGEDQSPFIYEKVGNRFEKFMVDEFQDTSSLQWKNLQPLIENSMAEGNDNLVVGDVKQSIYRWRNSDWRILGVDLYGMVDGDRFISKPLTSNWRSLSNIIRFNNSLFTVIPEILDNEFKEDSSSVSFSNIYSEAIQNEPKERPGGYVRIEFIANEDEMKAQEKILARLPEVVETIQQNGYNASDIGILVRDNREGARVLKTFIDYSNNASQEKLDHFNYNIVSGDSLLLSNSHVINFIISVLRVVSNPEDMISRALMLRYYLLSTGNKEADTVSLVSEMLTTTTDRYFPEGYNSLLEKIRQLPLFEATEKIIGFFGLGTSASDIAYLTTFQDHVVSFTGNRSADLQSFLEWWEDTGSGKSVVLPGDQNAMRILTIHKSKGLEFEVVIIPFLTWPLDHVPAKQTFLWIKPDKDPFSEIGLVPVRYGSDLAKTLFSESYNEEKHSIFVDNINLLYVAFTRAREVIYGFSLKSPRKDSVAAVIRKAFAAGIQPEKAGCLALDSYYDDGKDLFEFGTLPVKTKRTEEINALRLNEYNVGKTTSSLKLKLRGENYFSPQWIELQERINYGKIMHTIFENIRTGSDVVSAVNKAVNEGVITSAESEAMCLKIERLIQSQPVSEWFDPASKVITESVILLPSGMTRRPDRVVFMDGRTVVIDFKFGEESDSYAGQVGQYKRLLNEMGYKGVEGYIWYVDSEKIVKV
jgi:ATP-dependent helicase/nuclease subunit A